jgi:hypothetical protein
LAPLWLAACAGGSPDTGTGPAPPADAVSVRFRVDTGTARRAISPYVYGVNQPEWTRRHRGVRLARLGGNRWTAYNWETNASNAGADYHHQNDDFLGGGDVPGEAVRPHVAAAHAAGAAIVVTLPMAGYVSADKRGDGDVAQTPDWLRTRFHESRAAKRAPFSYPPDTADAVVYQDEFVGWLEAAFPAARHDPTRAIFYSLDNEPDLWAHTHARIRPTGKLTYEELVERTLAWASAVKAVAPWALVFAPVNYGWQGFVTLQDAPDAGGRDFLDFFLASMREAEAAFGRRLVDVLDVHWYPEARGGGIRVTEADSSPAVAAARVQAPRSLWDPGYVETSWISQDAGVGAIRLIPRLRAKIAAHYPGTRLALTEYNYGGGGHVSGALALADVLGIFGREGVFAANLWSLSANEAFLDAALAAYCNLDGSGARFGDTSVAAVTSDPASSSVYASVDASSDSRVVVVAINKALGSAVAELSIEHTAELTRAQTFRLTAASPALVPGPALAPAARNLYRFSLPASSLSVIVLGTFERPFQHGTSDSS